MTEVMVETLGWWLAIAVGASVLSAFAYPVVAFWIKDLAPGLRSLVRLAYAGSAPLAALLAVVMVTQPDLALFFAPAHCHGELCGVHTPVYVHDSLVLLGLASVISLLVLPVLVMVLWALHRAHRRLRALSALTSADAQDYRTLDNPGLLACCVGLWQQKILLSRGLIEQLQPDELQIVLAHEKSHAERFDNLRALLLRWLTLFWPATLRQRINTDHRTDAELACDRIAARTVARPAQVAAVIRKLSDLSSSATTAASASRIGFNDGCTAARLQALQHCPGCNKTSASGLLRVFVCLSSNWCLQIYLLTSISHKLIEWLGTLPV